MDTITENLARKFTLTSDEEEGVVVPVTQAAARVSEVELSVVGKVLSAREYSSHTIKANILRLLQPVKGCTFDSIGPNRFVIKFEHHLDFKHAMSGCPWIMDKHAVALQELHPDDDPTTVDLNHISMVVRLYQIPIRQRNMEMAQQIGNKIGVFMELLAPKQQVYTQHMRVKVRLDVTKTLKRGIYLHTLDGSKEWVSFTYEKLPNFCFLCGIIGHGENKCHLRYEANFVDPGEQLPYGPWMRASVTNSGEPARLPLQPMNNTNQNSTKSPSIGKTRGVNIFEFTSQGVAIRGFEPSSVEKENLNTEFMDESNLINNAVHVQTLENTASPARKIISIPKKNRKKKAEEIPALDEPRLGKKPLLCLRDEAFISTAETAEQSRRSQ
ncbi:PREDICTED: uncharacterized protein LOC105961138 [Erythranthe guttata]|uniref:uncharacterized protein LOC105961138 n=1 Tax=Erythranthe guttata TaxID=4155 RepID=UPI00064D9998|nr:PREDICTED: uncharacterized protein LOC105961138 [Erythranthe guttata]|eukprot:XP_012840835.1 PREDICTED: uncharacterized protein LOC105961138 [Erythranthe guttata]